jgi:GNAT superfamily N-acetyltransferase
MVRRAEQQDIEVLIALCGEHAQFERATYEPAGKVTSLGLALFAPIPMLYAWLATVGGEVVGYATASPEYSTWNAAEYLHMDCLFVRSQKRNAGIGAALIASVVQYARAHRYAEVQWQTPLWNTDACRFYKRQGARHQKKIRFRLEIKVDPH